MLKWQELPHELLAVAIIVFAHGSIGLGMVAHGILESGSTDGTLRPLLNAGTMLCIAWGLFTRQRWGWWLGVFVVGFRAALAVVALLALIFFTVTDPFTLARAMQAVEEASGQPALWSLLWLVFLVAAFVLLLSPPVRDLFRTPVKGRP